MIVGDMSELPRYKKLADALETRLVPLLKWRGAYFAAQPPFPDGYSHEDDYDHPSAQYETRGNQIFWYLSRRAERPLLKALRTRYEELWGKTANYSYFFPQHTLSPIWRRARERANKELVE